MRSLYSLAETFSFLRGRPQVPAVTEKGEGDYRPGPYLLNDGWLSAAAGRRMNWWQMGHSLGGRGGRSTTVKACIACYAQTLAMCPGSHWRADGKGGRERVTNSALARWLKEPNGYQNISDFLLNLGSALYEDGNAYALAVRNDRFEISALHLMSSWGSGARIAATGDVFYQLGGNEIAERIYGSALQAVPARDVLHLRLNTHRHPLRGEPPLTSDLIDLSATDAATARAIAYTQNEAQLPGVIETDLKLTEDEVEQLRQRWNAVTQGAASGGTPILSSGLKWRQATPNARDAQLAELLQISDQRIASAYRVPLPMLNLASGQLPQTSTEPLMQFWLAGALGFTLNHIEEGIGRLFRLAGWPAEYLEFDTKALLRSSFKDRISGLVEAVRGAVYSPNEARAEEELPAVEFGDEPRVQQQVVPLSAWAQMQPQTPRPDAPPAPPPAPPSDGAVDPAAAEMAAAIWTKQIIDAANRPGRTSA